MNIIFFTNYFLKDSKVSPWFDESVGCLREAITMAISKGINVEAIIKVSEKDYNFFFNFFKNEKYINVQKLGTSSLNKRLPFIK